MFLAADNSIKNIGSEATPLMLDDYRHSLNSIAEKLMDMQKENKADGYILYLLGVILVKLEEYELAVEVLLESVHKVPINWHSWMQLGDLIVDRVKVNKMYIKKKTFVPTCVGIILPIIIRKIKRSRTASISP